ncbi:flavin reductase family protein [Zhongshania sp.]|jgi:flavin reductase (DIM6/NTAB) family NADH-FMN oxidoreductase RutF|uniref:flavin reductase family protein n=1 Tax=Zhongshania sp. TaxID=1971902 RepID=UPI0039E3824E
MIINRDDIEQMAQRYRGLFINSVLGAKPALLVGTNSINGDSNLAVMSSAFHLGANPPLVGLIIRPSESPRHTLNNILATGYYTINHVPPQYIEAAHQTSARYPEDQCEFKAVGLSKKYLRDFAAPFVEQSTIALGLKLREDHKLTINNTHMIIGEIQLIELPAKVLGDDGFVDIAANDSIAATGLDSYARIQALRRLSYAKIGQWPKTIDVP